jgi:hypothetical protein
MSELYNEIRGLPIFTELPDDIKALVGHIYLRKVPGGYTVAKKQGLAYMLINPTNIGHRVYNRQIVKWDAHPAIVDLKNYQYALQHLGLTDLDGNLLDDVTVDEKGNLRRSAPQAKRYTQHGNKREGLLVRTG